MNRKEPPALDQVLLDMVRSRLFLPLLVVSLAAICIAGYAGEQALENQQHQIAQSRALMVDRYLDHSGRMLDAVARVAEVSTPEDTATYMQGTWEAYRYFDTLYLFDKNNKITQIVPPDPRNMGMDMSNMLSYYTERELDNLSFSRPFISLRTGNPTIYIIRHLSTGETVVGELSLVALQQEIGSTTVEPGRDFVFILDQSGMLLAHPSSDLVRQQTNQGNLEIFHRGMGGNATLIYDYSGTMVLGSTARVDWTGWVVVDQIPLSVAFWPYALTLGLTLVALIVIWLALAWNLRSRLRQQVVLPLEQLTSGVTALANNDFSQGDILSPIPGTFTELDRLATGFVHMSNAVQERQADLQAGREDLLRKNEDLNAAYEKLTAAEEELRANFNKLSATEEALRESRQILEAVLNSIPVRVFWKDKNSVYLGGNTAFARDAGFEKPEEIIGKDDFAMAWHEQAGIYQGDDRAVIGSGKPKLLFEEPQTTPTGEKIHLLTSKVPMRDAGGEIIGVLGTYLDITERRRAEMALEQATKKLNLLNSITFTDIRNAIFSLSAYMVLGQKIPMDEKLRQFREKQIAIVRTISETLKFSDYYQSLGLKPPVWQNVAQSFLMGISHTDISHLSRRLDIDGLEIYADTLLENVFFTLAENVILHGKTATDLTLWYQESPKGLTLFFEDNGMGIRNDLKDTIFDRQYEEKRGMGLFLAREILSITGITIRETGEAGKGARFEMMVPKGAYRFVNRQTLP